MESHFSVGMIKQISNSTDIDVHCMFIIIDLKIKYALLKKKFLQLEIYLLCTSVPLDCLYGPPTL